jgi:hypothetical protein
MLQWNPSSQVRKFLPNRNLEQGPYSCNVLDHHVIHILQYLKSNVLGNFPSVLDMTGPNCTVEIPGKE